MSRARAKSKPVRRREKTQPPTPAPAKRRRAWQLVDRQQLATLMGVHPDTVTDYARADMPVVTRGGRGATSAYDAVECLKWQRQQIGKNAKENAQTRLIELNADLKSLQLELEQGQLLSRDDVVRQTQAFGKGLQAMVRALPRRSVQAGVPAEYESLIADVCRDILTEISRWQSEQDLPKDPKAA